MQLYKFIFVLCACFLFPSNSETNNTKLNNFNNETDITEISLCENFSTTCYPHSTEVSTDMSFFQTEDNISTTYKKTTIFYEDTTSLPSSTVPPQMKKEPTDMENCPCDLTPYICDMNCCCDVDCSEWERDAFYSCTRLAPQPSFGQCMTTDIIYKNNTAYPTTRSVNGLLCIAKDNFPERNAYIDQDVIKSIQTFERVWKRKLHYYWVIYKQKQVKTFMKTEIYKYGEPLWKYTNLTGETTYIEYPAPLTSFTCQIRKPIFYLKDFKSSCLQIVPKTEKECTIKNKDFNAKLFCQDLTLISSPSFVNGSAHVSDSPDETFVKVKQLICLDDDCDETSSYPEPTFDSNSNTCKNIVKMVQLIMKHNGSMGISEAYCKITLLPLLPEQAFFEQKFEVIYLPARLANISDIIFRRSGTPGYRAGMPVLTKLHKENEFGLIHSLSVISGKNCASNTSVLFKENLRIHCIWRFPINSTWNCTLLEEQIINKMLKGVGEVGVTGDPDSWLEPPFTLVTASTGGSTCSPVTSLSLDFLYSYKGTLLKPEAKIVGLMNRFDGRQIPDCSSQFCSLRLVTMISFTDISRPVLSKYASAPVVKIKLPRDFFYPFSSSASQFVCFKCWHMVGSVTLVFNILYHLNYL